MLSPRHRSVFARICYSETTRIAEVVLAALNAKRLHVAPPLLNGCYLKIPESCCVLAAFRVKMYAMNCSKLHPAAFY